MTPTLLQAATSNACLWSILTLLELIELPDAFICPCETSPPPTQPPSATRGSPLPAHLKKPWKRSHFPVVNNCCFVCLDTFSYKNFKKKKKIPLTQIYLLSSHFWSAMIVWLTTLTCADEEDCQQVSSQHDLLKDCYENSLIHRTTTGLHPQHAQSAGVFKLPWRSHLHQRDTSHFFCSKVADHLGSFTLSGTFTQTNRLAVSGSYRVPWGSPSCERRGIWLHSSCVAYLQLLKITQWLKGCWQHS